jgi:hypothetical protein
MKPLAKGLLIGCGTVVLLVAAAAVGLVWFVNENKGEWMAQGRAVRDEGARAGAQLGGAACVDRTFARYASKRGIGAAIDARVWLDGCLAASPTGGDACPGVPSTGEISRSITWRLAECERRGLGGDSSCSSVLQGVQTFCDHAPGPPGR